jgi:hypothetical protein
MSACLSFIQRVCLTSYIEFILCAYIHVCGVVSTGFLQIAMVFARTGQMDRAVDLTRRALYCYECAFIEVTAHPSIPLFFSS